MTGKRSTSKPKGKAKAGVKKAAAPKSRATKTPKAKPSRKPAKAARSAKPKAVESGTLDARVGTVNMGVPESPKLLRETKTTVAALGILEKGIKLIYQKEFKKARIELTTLLQEYPAEHEILARARSYIQICDREEATRKPAVSIDQIYTLGVMEHNRGYYEKAISIFRQSLEKDPESDHILYSLAASFAMKGELLEAVRHLRKAIELNEENRVYAKNDSDFASLHGEREFADLVGWSPPEAGEQP